MRGTPEAEWDLCQNDLLQSDQRHLQANTYLSSILMMTNPIQNIEMIGKSGLRMTLYNRSMIVASLDETFTEHGSQFNAIALEEYLFNKRECRPKLRGKCL